MVCIRSSAGARRGGAVGWFDASGQSGAWGGYAQGTISLSAGQTIYVAVGGRGEAGREYIAYQSLEDYGSPARGGWNGGGDAGMPHVYSTDLACGGGGGGATSVTTTLIGDGQLKNYSDARGDVLLVAGGGGSEMKTYTQGYGGGEFGGTGEAWYQTYTCPGGTQTTGYAFGQGQSAADADGSSGGSESNPGAGGGWYGGYAQQIVGEDTNCPAGGGSGHINGDKVIDGSMQGGVNEGNGRVIITRLPYTDTIHHGIDVPSSANHSQPHVNYFFGDTTIEALPGDSVTLDRDRAITPPKGYYLQGNGTASDKGGLVINLGDGAGDHNESYGYTFMQPANDVEAWYYYNPESYSITYDLAGGVQAASNPVHYTIQDSITLEAPTRTGWRFLGWYDEAGNKVESINPEAFPLSYTSEAQFRSVMDGRTTGNLKLTAKWEQLPFTLAYTATTGGSVSRSSETVTSASGASGATATAQPGYKFAGWYSGSRKVSDDATYVPAVPDAIDHGQLSLPSYGDKTNTVIAYDADSDTYDVDCNFALYNGSQKNDWGLGICRGNGPVSPSMVPFGQKFIASFDICADEDSKIVIDINNSVGPGHSNFGPASFNDNDSITDRNAYVNGQPFFSILRSSQGYQVKAGEWVHVTYIWTNTSSYNTDKLSLYDYTSLDVLPNGSGTDTQHYHIKSFEAVISPIELEDAAIYTAHFEPTAFTVEYAPNGGALASNAGSKWTMQDGALLENESSNHGFADYTHNLTQAYSAGYEDAIDLYNLNSGPTDFYLKRSGYHIDPGEEWYILDGSSKKVFSQDVVYKTTDFADTSSSDAHVKLYANWKPNTYTVHFDANAADATGTMADESFTYDSAKALSANAFTRPHFAFTGWNTKADGSGTSYTDCQSVSNLTDTQNGTVTLYAQWKRAETLVDLSIFTPDGGQPWQTGGAGTLEVSLDGGKTWSGPIWNETQFGRTDSWFPVGSTILLRNIKPAPGSKLDHVGVGLDDYFNTTPVAASSDGVWAVTLPSDNPPRELYINVYTALALDVPETGGNGGVPALQALGLTLALLVFASLLRRARKGL